MQDLKPLEEMLDEPFLGIARKLVAVEEIPTWDELESLYNDLEENEGHRSGLSYSHHNGGWYNFCVDLGIYQAFSYEFIEGLVEEIKGLNVKGKIVEIGAGNGKLSYWLQQFGVPSVATDDYSWENIDRDPEHVERLTHSQALAKYEPELVIACFVVPEINIATDVMDAPYVRHCLEIGIDGDGGGYNELWDREGIQHCYLKSTDQFSLTKADANLDHSESFATLFTKDTNN